MALRKRKSRKQQAADLAVGYLKLKAVGKAAKGAKKAATKTPVVKRIPVLVGAGVAAIVATKVVRGRGGDAAAAH
jgi:hypothetical protein